MILQTFKNSWNAVESDKSFDNVEVLIVSFLKMLLSIKFLQEKVQQHSEHIPEIQAYWKSSADDFSQPPPIIFHKCVFTTFIEVYKVQKTICFLIGSTLKLRKPPKEMIVRSKKSYVNCFANTLKKMEKTMKKPNLSLLEELTNLILTIW